MSRIEDNLNSLGIKAYEPHCYICYSKDVEPEMVCDTCDEIYCEDCSYTFTIHYQHQGSRCFWCSEQRRLKPLSKETIRDNKLKLFIKN